MRGKKVLTGGKWVEREVEKSIAFGERGIASFCIKGSGGGSVGRAGAFFTRGPWFESR